MPHLDASALESDPKGMALLREVIGMPTRTGSWIASKPHVLPSPPTTRRRHVATAALRLLGFALLIAAIVRSREPSRAVATQRQA